MSNRLTLLLQAIFYFLVAYLPFQVALNITAGIDLMSGRVFILCLFSVWLAGKLYSEKNSLKGLFKNHLALALVLFFILAALSIIVADNQTWGIRKLLFFASLFPAFWLVSFLITEKKERLRVLYLMVGGAALSALIALAQFLGQFIFGLEAIMAFWSGHILPLFSGASFGSLVASNPSWLANVGGQTIMRAIGLFPDPHMLSFYLGLVSPFALALAFWGKEYRGLFFAIYGFLIGILLLTFSRGGYLGFLISSAVLIFIAWRLVGARGKKLLLASGLMAVGIIVLVGWPITSRLFSSFDLREGSNLGRLAIWQDSWQIIKARPVLGVGLGNYSLAAGLEPDYRNAVTSHNLYLDIWAELGLAGLLVWLFVFWQAIKSAIKKIKQEPVLALGALGALVYFFVHSFFESAVFNPTVLAFFMVILGLAGSELKEKTADKKFN